MKRSPLQRRTPLKRSPIGARSRRDRTEPRARSAYRDRERFPDYMLWVKTRPCLMRGVWGSCSGAVEADHAGPRGLSHKAHDSTCIPLCTKHHMSRFPHHVTHEQRSAWLHAAVVYTRACARAVSVHVPVDPAPMCEYAITSRDIAWLELVACTAAWRVVTGT